MREIVETFSKKSIQEALNLDLKLKEAQCTWDELREWWTVDRIKETKKLPAPDRRPTKKCKKCGYVMVLYPVNTKSDEIVKGDYKSMWLCGSSCSRRGCLSEEYSTNTVEQEVELLNNIEGE